MKKMLALILALLMALSCTGALAEEATPVTMQGTVHFNEEMLSSLIGMASPEMGEAEMQAMDTLMAVLNNLGFQAVIGKTNAQIVLTLKGMPVMTVVAAETEKGYAAVSDLFPNYALTVSQETIDELTQSALSSMPEMDAAAMEAALAAHGQALLTALKGYAGAPVAGEYTVEEGLTFNCQIPYEITATELAALILNAAKAMLKDPALAPLLTAAGEISEADIDAALADLTGDAENQPDLNVALYANMDADGNLGEDFYLAADMGDDEFVVGIMAGVVDKTLSATLIFGDAIYASMDEMIAAAVDGSGEAFVIDLFVAPGEKETDASVSMDVYAMGQYMGYYMETLTEETVTTSYAEIYYMDPEAPLMSIEVLSMPTGEDVTLNLTDETPVVTMESLLNDTEGTASMPLMMDVMSYGINNVLANAAAAMPDEITALITLLNTPAETEETTVEGVTEMQ